MISRALFFTAALLAVSGAARAATPGQNNTPAILMFLLFVAGTMGITWWAARRTKTTSDFYTAGGGITGFQNGRAIAGDYLSAASFLGIAGMVYVSGFDGMAYTIGFLFGWPPSSSVPTPCWLKRLPCTLRVARFLLPATR